MMNNKTMLISSILAGLFSTMNIWTVSKNHIRFHLNDIYMVILMTSWMFLFMILFSWSHYDNPRAYLIISIIILTLTLIAIRKQLFINDQQYIRGMIPHHSMAILMSQKILDKTKNPEIKELSKQIIKTQEEEINLMTNML